MRRKRTSRARSVPVLETMEPRLLLASAFVISEFMADNTKTLKDKDGAYSDWIEINNTGTTTQNLNGYYLTDSPGSLMKWRFPSATVAGGGYLVVFASNKNIITGTEFHTNFRLSAGGDYLALVEPDGHTIAYEFAPQYPQQYTDISYGTGQDVVTKTLVALDAAAAAYIPADNSLGSTWTQYDFNDAGWTIRGQSPVGYESKVAGWAVRDYLANLSVTTLSLAESVISAPANRRDATVYSQTSFFIHYRNTGDDAHYTNGLNPPGISPPGTLTTGLVMEAEGWITIPQAGLYTFGVNTDDGFGLTITGATTTWVQNTTTAAGSEVMDFQGVRSPADSFATYTFPTAGQYPIRFVWFQNTGGAEAEVFATPGSYRAFNYTDYKLVGDTGGGGLAVQSIPVIANTYDQLVRTDVGAMKGANSSAYIRIPFNVTDTALYNSLTLRMRYDDGFVAYLNGAEVARRYAPGTVTWNSSSTAERTRANALVTEEIDITSKLGNLRTGTNVLAIQALNYGASNEDLLVWPELVDTDLVTGSLHYFATPTPGSVNLSAYYAYVKDTKFSVDRGFYDVPIDVEITTTTPGAEIRYTTNGTPPTATTGTVYTGPIHITTTTTLRAAAYLTGFQPTNVDTQTYIFLSSVLTQPASPAGFPTSWGGTAADYAMDQSVVNNAAYSGEIRNDLKAISTLSIVMKTDDMFGPSGIYSNTQQQGEAWERAASVELINPDGTPGFQVEAGIRIYGGVNRDPSVKKHTMRLFFNDNQFGPADLKYPLFPDTNVDTFDSVILKGFFNDAWGPMSWNGQSQYARDTWAMYDMLAMGQPASHVRYFHVYINGLYWGMYAAMERPDQHFGEAYLGGDSSTYDVIHDTEAVAGDRNAWNAMMNMANAGLASDAQYQAIQQIVDVTNLADYCLLNFYTENWDWDDHNWYASRDRNGGQWHFFPWDTEWTLPSDLSNPNMMGTNRSDRPSHVFQQMLQNPDYRMLVADRVYKQYYNNGPMSPAALAARYQQITDGIYYAIVGESARWGDYNRAGNPYLRNGEWLSERNRLLNSYFPQRQAIFIQQLKSAGLYPNTEAPGFSQNGGTIGSNFQLTITNPNTSGTPPATVGTIYYTLDGSDPRLSGGGISANALVYTGPIALRESTMVRSRVKNGNAWSAMHEAAFVTATPPPLRITELMYHPENAPPNSNYTADDFQYIEVKNIGTEPLNLSGMSIQGASTFTFPNMTLPAGSYALVVANLPAFQSRYADWSTMTIAGAFTDGHLAHGGEEVLLKGKFGETILDFTYDSAWYPASDGMGYSLNIVNASAAVSTWGLSSSWQLSNYAGGSPGTDNAGLLPGSIAVNELLAHSDMPMGDWVELRNTTPDPIAIGGWWLSDSRTELQKYQIAAGTILQPGQYFLLNERDNFGNPADSGCHVVFGYSEYGETVFLTGTDQAGNLTGYREEQEFGASDREVAFTRYVTSTGNVDFVAESTNTPMADNAPPLVGPVVINEVMYHPLNDTDEFIELKNITGSPVPLYDPARPANTWKFDGGITYTFAAGLSIPAGGYLLVVATDPLSFRTKYSVPPAVQIVGPYTGALNNSGDNLKLYKPGDPDPLPPYPVPYYLVDRTDYKPLAPWPVQPNGFGPSLERSGDAVYGNDPVNWYAGPDEGTPGRVNGLADVTPPRLVTVSAGDGDPLHIIVEFNEAVDPVTSQVASNYNVPGLTIDSVAPGSNNRLVILSVSPMTNGTYYTVTATGVKNLANILIAGANLATFSYSGAGVGLWGQYYQYQPGNINWSNLKVARTDATINFDWGGGSPDQLLLSDLFSVRWTGKVKPLYTETFTFYTYSEDGVRLWVNNQLIIDNWTEHTGTEDAGTIALTAGQKYDIKIEYYENAGMASMKLSWSSLHTAKAIVPTSSLFSNAVPAITQIDSYMLAASTVLTVPAESGVLVNDADPNGYSLTAVARRRASHGTVTLRSDGGFTYTPTAGYSGPDTFSYYAYNGLVNSAETLVYLTVDAPPAVTTVSVNRDGTARGLEGYYYQYGAGGVDWANLRFVRRDPGIDYDWGAGSPDPALAADQFAVRWVGRIIAPFSDTYTFYTYSDAGARLWINNKLVIDNWTAHTATETTGAYTFFAGDEYDIKVEYYEDAGPAVMRLSWSSPNTPKAVVPASALLPVERTAGSIDPGQGGIQTVDITFSKDMTFLPEDVLVERVAFTGNAETVLGTVTPTNVYGYGFDFMTITLPGGEAVDTWLKVTLKGNGTLQAKDNLHLKLDGEPKTGGSGRSYIYNSAIDMPSGNGVEGGDAVFYVGNLRGDFGSANGARVSDGVFNEADIDGFLGRMQAGDMAADLRGTGFGPGGPDGLLTPEDFDAFMTFYQQTAVQPASLAPLPDPGPQGDGEPQPLAAGGPDPVESLVLTDAGVPLAAGDPAPLAAVSADALLAPADVDLLATAVVVDPSGASPAAPIGLVPAALPPVEQVVMLTAVGMAAPAVPLAFVAANEVAPQADPVLAPDGGMVDLLTLPALNVPLVA